MEFDLTRDPVPQDSHRPGVGWFAFFILVGLLILVQLDGYLNRDKGSGDDRTAANVERSLRMSMEYMAGIRGMLGDKAPKEDYARMRSELSRLEEPKASEEAAMVAISLRRLLGDDPKPSSLSALAKSKDTKVRQLAVLLENPDLQEPEVRALKDRLPDRFASQLIWSLRLEELGVKDARLEVVSPERGQRLFVFAVVLMLAGGLGVAAWIAYAVARLAGKARPVGHPADPLSSPNADRMAGRATQLLALFFLIPFVIVMIVGSKPPKGTSIVLALLVIGLSLALLTLPIFGRSLSFAQVGLRHPRRKSDYLWVVGALLAEIPLLAVLAAISYPLQQFFPAPEHPITVRLAEGADLWTLIGTFVSASLMAPIVEEIIFRGLVTPAMAKLFRSTAIGVVIAALCFAAIHPTGIPAWLPLAGVGFISAMLTYQTGSLMPSIIFHGVHNAAILTLTLAVLS